MVKRSFDFVCMKSKQKLDEICHLDKCPFTFQELPETSAPNSMKASLERKRLDLPGTTSTQQEKRWIGDSEGHHCLCVCFWCLQRRGFFFLVFFEEGVAICSKKGRHCVYMQASREWSLCWGIKDNTIWTSHTAFLSCLNIVRQGKQDRNGHFSGSIVMWNGVARVSCLWWSMAEHWQAWGNSRGNKLGQKVEVGLVTLILFF